MNDLYKNKFRVTSARLPCWDYGSNGLYYVTICTKDRMHYWGDIVAEPDGLASLNRSAIGEIAHNNWLDIPNHFSFIELDDFVIMPNHIHGILYINKPDKISWEFNKFGKQSQNLASDIRGFKASVKTYATTNGVEFDWQPRYHDHVIRTEKEYLNICRYIANNPGEWLLNGDNVDNLYKT
ncbi:transposase [Mucilaginibacter sp.]|uniref:transposase n=1 Tax=Mucilaginibacter sp. TaxID=1882438 RepID=UPI002840FD3F|nr:transposase [Mucilaginibacter sp.]MDR3693899.1 transposase [Mucilaginibacter sp.]